MKTENFVLNGMMGLVVGDALGVPVEFMIREELKADPVIDMRNYGTHEQPKGTWSDDSSMAIATMDSLCQGVNYEDMMKKFCEWVLYGEYTPYGDVFDIGISTRKAILNYGKGIEPLQCGGKTEGDNGNGSLMRILPFALYVCGKYNNLYSIEENKAMNMVHKVSCLTHAHPRSQIGCGFYTRFLASILQNKGQNSLLDIMKESAKCTFKHYEQGIYPKVMTEELKAYERLHEIESFAGLSEDNIHSTGYVVHTLEAAIWCFITTNNYKDCVLKAVNLGGDTDTIGAVAGGLAGCYYGYENIPKDWLAVIKKREWIEELCNKMQMQIEKERV